MRKGSLTVFYSMTIMILMSLFLTMVEVVREKAMETTSVLYTKEAVESSFSEFNAFMWKNYGILGMDFGYNGQAIDMTMLETKLMEYAEMNSNPEIEGFLAGDSNYTRMEPVNAKVEKYGILSDNGGTPLIVMGAKQVVSEIPEAILDQWLSQMKDIDGVSLGGEDKFAKVAQISDAKRQAEAEKEAAIEEAIQNGIEYEEEDLPLSEDEYDDPAGAFSEISTLLSKGVLSMVIPNASELSSKKLYVDRVSTRQRYNGTIADTTEINVAEKLLYGQYLLNYFEYYGHQLPKEGLDYELEYVLFGRNSDIENLAAMAERLLLIREGQNLVSMGIDNYLRNQARTVATAVVGWTGNPVLITIVQIAVMAIWAFIESVLDVRTLFAGGRVAFLKNFSNWTSRVTHLLQVVDVNFRASESETGMTYKDYIRGFLAAEGKEKLGLRSLDAIEYAIRTQEGCEKVRADQLLYIMEPNISYRGVPMFLSMVSVGRNNINEYTFNTSNRISYLQ